MKIAVFYSIFVWSISMMEFLDLKINIILFFFYLKTFLPITSFFYLGAYYSGDHERNAKTFWGTKQFYLKKIFQIFFFLGVYVKIVKTVIGITVLLPGKWVFTRKNSLFVPLSAKMSWRVSSHFLMFLPGNLVVKDIQDIERK